MRSSQPVEAEEMCQELLESIYSDATLADIRDLLLTFKEKGVRAPQLGHFLTSIVHQNQGNPENNGVTEEVEDKLFDVLDMISGLMSDNFTIWQHPGKWGVVKPIFYLEKLCPICNCGILGFRRLNNTENIVIACHECESGWARPDKVTPENVIHVLPPDFGVAELGASIFGENAAWATADEIQMHGWGKYIAGEEISVY